MHYVRAKLEFESAKIIVGAVTWIWNLLWDPDPKLVLQFEVNCSFIITSLCLNEENAILIREETY